MSAEIAARKYRLVENGQDAEMTVRLFEPELHADGVNFQCRIQVEWPSKTQDLHAGGVDAIQALVLALKMLGSIVNTSDAATKGNLVWLEPGSGFGLPVPRNIEDILQGDDRQL